MDDFAQLQSSIQTKLVATTRSVGQLAAEDLSFHRSLDKRLGTQLDAQNARLLGLAERLLGSATANTEAVCPRLKDIDDVESNWARVVDVVDSLLERADTALDEFTGAVKRLTPRESTPTAKSSGHVSKLAAALRNQDLEKPQLHFENVPDNKSSERFRPLLLSKPHAITQLQSQVGSPDDADDLHYEHPYQQEIEQYSYPSSVYARAEPINYHPFDSTTATFVDSEEALEKMLQELKAAKEIAIDVEHHDLRSYVGIVCLLQISTRDQDWIIDTLKPWRRKLQCLNQVFADPRILKVLHGAYMDIIWLQRDLGLYLVGLFDTHFAARALGYPGGSYAFLLKKFTGVDAQKQFQTADWRIRPLPKELIDYARSDTHYLLYIYDNMRNELIQRSNLELPDHEGDRIHAVLERSKETALQRYDHAVYDFELGQGTNGWYKLLSRTPAQLSREQFAVFRSIHRWRDHVAREQDDSVHYVMPNHVIFTLARAMPTSRAELLSAAQPATQALRVRADEMTGVILQAKKDGASGPEMMDVLSKVEPQPVRRAAERAATFEGVAKYMPQPSAVPPAAVNGVLAAVTSALPLRSVKSMFWGSSLDNPRRQQRRSASTGPEVQLTVPLPPLTAEVFADPQSVATPAQTPREAARPAATVAAPPELDEDEEGMMVLKEMGKKRKRAGEVAMADEVALPNDEAERLRQKAERKKAKKEAKRAAKAAGVGDEDGAAGEEEVEEEAPFDYASAPSMLSQPGAGREAKKKGQKAQANPYAKAMDTSKGLPRVQKERAGKSMTYRS